MSFGWFSDVRDIMDDFLRQDGTYQISRQGPKIAKSFNEHLFQYSMAKLPPGNFSDDPFSIVTHIARQEVIVADLIQ